MPTLRSYTLLTIVILLALSVSCKVATVPAQATPKLPTVIETDSPPTSLPALQPTRLPATTPASQRNPAPKPTHNTRAQTNNQGSSATQNISFEVPAHPIDVILGRPTDKSITASVLTYQDAEGYLEYGPAPDNFACQTPLTNFIANQPVEILIEGLQTNSTYAYRVRYRTGTTGAYAATEPETFSTQRTADSPFTFTIQADSHLDSNSNPQVYQQTLANQRTDQPDFVIDLGDTFMTDKFKPFTAAELQYLAQRYYLSLIGQAAPLFLVLGNHDGEGAPKGNSGQEMSIWSAKLRTQLFPNPIPDGFYTGNATPEQTINNLENYYAWEWGDALFIVLDPYWFTPPLRDDSSLWTPTLGETQYRWLKNTLETSQSKWKFVFIHQLIGGYDKNGRGGVEVAPFYEWGGNNADGSYGFDTQRPGWGLPIHQLLVANNVTAVFHGHDHLFIKQELDGIIYQEVPQPSASRSNGTNSAVEYGYLNGDVLGSSGHLRVSVTSELVTVEYVRAYLPQDERAGQQNGQVDYRFTISNP
ncbi:MAG: metallophosphoesterase [Chloroflexi bacterium]|nr:metallophosphoesterase [Chloroflexota bacterium]